MKAKRMGWFEDICAHMEIVKRPNGYWTEARCASEAAKFSTRGKFALGCPAAYDASWKRGWLDDICGHMPDKPRKAAA